MFHNRKGASLARDAASFKRREQELLFFSVMIAIGELGDEIRDFE
jgi:hypothetical protein